MMRGQVHPLGPDIYKSALRGSDYWKFTIQQIQRCKESPLSESEFNVHKENILLQVQ